MKTKIVKFVALVIILGVLLKNMWHGDDIFLTMRTLDNFVNGFGLVWNVGERVQIYTHPLWMLILLPFYYFIESPYVTLYLINGITTLSVMVILLLTQRLIEIIKLNSGTYDHLIKLYMSEEPENIMK